MMAVRTPFRRNQRLCLIAKRCAKTMGKRYQHFRRDIGNRPAAIDMRQQAVARAKVKIG